MQLKNYRIQNKLSVAKVAQNLSVTRQHIYEIERGSAFPGRSLALRISEYTNGAVSVEDLLFPNTV